MRRSLSPRYRGDHDDNSKRFRFFGLRLCGGHSPHGTVGIAMTNHSSFISSGCVYAERFNFHNALLQRHSMQPKKSFAFKAKRILKLLGPGIITGASDDDPSGIVTYTQAGAGFGFATLWTALLTFPLMATIQGMCARIGLVTSKGLTGTLKDHYPKPILYLIILCSFPAISMNIGSDLQGMGAVAHLIVPRIPAFAFSILFTILLTVLMIRFPYERISKILKVALPQHSLIHRCPFSRPPRLDRSVLHHTFIPEFHFTKEYISIFVAILGTTISPYLFFWQATMEAEDVAHQKQKIVVNKRVLSEMATDVNVGMFLSNVVMFFLILTAGAVLVQGRIAQSRNGRPGCEGTRTTHRSFQLFAVCDWRYRHRFSGHPGTRRFAVVYHGRDVWFSGRI